MTETDEKKDKSAQAAEMPDTKLKAGRKPKEFYQAPVQEIINLTAPMAARIIQYHIEGKRGYKVLRTGLLNACYYVIDHAIGKARQKMEVTGGRMTYLDLANSADDLDKNPRPILVQVAEILAKHNKNQQENNDTNTDNQPEPS